MATAGMPKQPSLEDCDLSLKKKSWCWLSVIWYKQLPIDLRAEKKISIYNFNEKWEGRLSGGGAEWGGGRDEGVGIR